MKALSNAVKKNEIQCNFVSRGWCRRADVAQPLNDCRSELAHYWNEVAHNLTKPEEGFVVIVDNLDATWEDYDDVNSWIKVTEFCPADSNHTIVGVIQEHLKPESWQYLDLCLWDSLTQSFHTRTRDDVDVTHWFPIPHMPPFEENPCAIYDAIDREQTRDAIQRFKGVKWIRKTAPNEAEFALDRAGEIVGKIMSIDPLFPNVPLDMWVSFDDILGKGWTKL